MRAIEHFSLIPSAYDTIVTAGTASIPGWDAKYTMDNLNLAGQAENGTLSAGSISSRSRDEWWKQSGGSAGLSPAGTWPNHHPSRNGIPDGNGAFGSMKERGEQLMANYELPNGWRER